MSQDYDVVIVGAGIAGSIVASYLTERGRSVLVLEAGTGAGATWEGYRGFLDTFYKASAKVPDSPYPANPNAPQQDVISVSQLVDGQPNTNGWFVQSGPMPFLSDNVRNLGGTTLHWLATTLRMLPRDFRLKTEYGHAVDWPISYEDLLPFYELAEEEIGVSADAEDQRQLEALLRYRPGKLFPEGHEFPMSKLPQSYLDRTFTDAVSGMSVELSGEKRAVAVVSTPQGRNSMPNPRYKSGAGYLVKGAVDNPYSGLRCEGNASCVPICPVQAKYNALKTLQRVSGKNIITQAVASNIDIDPASGRVTGIVYKKYDDPKSAAFTYQTARGRLYVIATHAVETAKLVLASGLARTSGQLGRNLLDHPTLVTWGLMPQNIGAYRGPGSTSNIASFRDGAFRKHHSAFIVPVDNWGWLWPRIAPMSNLTQAVDQQAMFGSKLRAYLGDVIPRQFGLQWEFEQLPDPENRVTIAPQYKDRLGNYRPVVTYNVSEYTRAAIAVAKSLSNAIFARIGAEDYSAYNSTDPGYLEYNNVGYTVLGAGHMAGTHRMGTTATNSVVDRNQRTWDHRNLFLVGPGSMATIGTSNPTLTVAALAFMSAKYIHEKELR